MSIIVFILYINEKVILLRIKTILALNLLFNIIFTIGLINTLLANIDKMFSIANIDYIFSKTLLIINLVLNLSLLLMLIQSLNS